MTGEVKALQKKMEGIMHTREGLIIALAEAQRKREFYVIVKVLRAPLGRQTLAGP